MSTMWWWMSVHDVVVEESVHDVVECPQRGGVSTMWWRRVSIKMWWRSVYDVVVGSVHDAVEESIYGMVEESIYSVVEECPRRTGGGVSTTW